MFDQFFVLHIFKFPYLTAGILIITASLTFVLLAVLDLKKSVLSLVPNFRVCLGGRSTLVLAVVLAAKVTHRKRRQFASARRRPWSSFRVPFFFFIQYDAKRLAGQNVSEMTSTSGTQNLNSINQSTFLLLRHHPPRRRRRRHTWRPADVRWRRSTCGSAVEVCRPGEACVVPGSRRRPPNRADFEISVHHCTPHAKYASTRCSV